MRSGLLRVALVGAWLLALSSQAEAVVPVMVGPLQALLAILPSLLLALGSLLLAFFLGLFRPSKLKKAARFLWRQKVFTVILVAAIVGVVFLLRHNWGRAGPAASEMRAGSDWVAFRGNALRRGAVLDAPDPTLPEPVWSFKKDVSTVFASPAVVGNRLYVSTAEKGVFSDSGAILCIDAETGGEVWRYAPSDFRATFSSPAVAGGYVVCGEGLHYTDKARITCLDLQGKRLWELRTKSHVESSPCIYNGRAYVGAGDDGYYCVDLKPGPGGKPNVVWHLAGERYKDCETSHLAADGVVYLGQGMEGNAICALDAEKGTELWRLDTPYPVFGPPALANGKLYVAMGNGDYVNTPEQFRESVLKKMRQAGKPAEEIAAAEKRLGPAGEIWCIDAKTHKVEWQFKVPETVLGAVAVSGERLYFGCRDGHLYCVSTAGKLIGKWNAHSPVMTSPAVGAEHAYFGTAAGRLHCLRADTLEPVWETGLGEGTNFLSSPTLALGHIYIGTDGEGLRCIGRAGKKLPPLWTNMERGGSDGSSLPERGQLLWRYPKETNEKFVVTAPIVPWGDGLAVPCTLDGKAMLLKLKLGRGIEDEQRVAWKTEFPNPIRIAPATLGESVFLVNGVKGEKGTKFHSFYGSHAAIETSMDLWPDASPHFSIDRMNVYMWRGAKTLHSVPIRAGDEFWPKCGFWVQDCTEGGLPPAAGEGILTVATNAELMALDDSTGTVLWRVPLNAAPLFGPVRLPKGIVLATPKGIAVHKIVDGSVAWTAAVGPLAAPPNADADRIAAITQSGELIVLATGDGKQLAKVSDVAGRVPPLLLGDKVLFVNKDLTLLREGEVAPVQWARTAWLGTVTTPLVLLDGCVYFATETKGVVCVGAGRR
jgi:outer membrane protein assembly factor BamB